jgi:hypothetical protein
MTNNWHLFEMASYRARMLDREYIKRGGEITEPTKAYIRTKYLGDNKWTSSLVASRQCKNTCHLPINIEKSSEEFFKYLVSPARGAVVSIDHLKKIVIDEGDDKLLKLIDQSFLKAEEQKKKRIEREKKLGIIPIECDLENQFECLCKLASDEVWCHNLGCTTCGHMHFRYAFVLMANGIKIQDKVTIKRMGDDFEVKGWCVRSGRNISHQGLGVMPREYSQIQKDRVAKICANANLSVIAEHCRSSIWRGYLGLVVVHMASDSDAYKDLSIRWAKQLLDMGEGRVSDIGEDSTLSLQRVVQGDRVLNGIDVWS